MIELRNCTLTINHIGTREQIEMEIFIEELPKNAERVATALRLLLADAFENMARGFCQMSKNWRAWHV